MQLDEIQIEGPIAPLPHQIAFVKGEPASGNQRYLESVLLPFARRAYRRPLTEQEKDQLVSKVIEHLKVAPSREYALHYGIRRILCSPQFLYIDGPQVTSRERLNDHGLASRLSYFLWSSMPDDELMQLADEGRLSDSNVLRKQVLRMLDDDKAQRFVTNFTGQWLSNRVAASRMVCDVRHVWSNLMRYGYVRSTELFFDEILRENLPIKTFIDSDFTYANDPMLIAWKVPGKFKSMSALEADQRQSLIWPEPERLDFSKLPADSPEHVKTRGGILGLSGVLTATGDGVESSPILRGVMGAGQPLGHTATAASQQRTCLGSRHFWRQDCQTNTGGAPGSQILCQVPLEDRSVGTCFGELRRHRKLADQLLSRATGETEENTETPLG